ncbi:hypothetical protein A4X09_0g4553 [Tilletia walkeri]|uniref:Trimethylguanosine synthase n=1 Tax=Tilletia walkeri TaxID=117179 RepID=A0A8X7N7E2_9BASI|nr:hypothetical protein A4X09_0g4553 [Tilletia walkeri]
MAKIPKQSSSITDEIKNIKNRPLAQVVKESAIRRSAQQSTGASRSPKKAKKRPSAKKVEKAKARREAESSARSKQTLKSRWSNDADGGDKAKTVKKIQSQSSSSSAGSGSDSGSALDSGDSEEEEGEGDDDDSSEDDSEEEVDQPPAQQPRKKQRVSFEPQQQQRKKQPQQSKQRYTSSHHPLALSRFIDLPPELRKYFNYRYDLFSLYDSGISLDATSWFSVTPESIAARIAERCRSHTILDAFAGAGGNAIQFAKVCERVVAVEIDPVKVEMARHNARIYGVEERITFLTGDVREFAEAHRRARLDGSKARGGDDDSRWNGAELLDFDVIFLSPPWGGPTYLKPTQNQTSTSRSNSANNKLNARERRTQRRADQNGQGKVASVTNDATRKERNGHGQNEDSFDAALAAQLGLPLSFTGRLIEVEDSGEEEEEERANETGGREDAEAMEVEEDAIGDVTATPWVDPRVGASTNGDPVFTNTYSLSRLEPIPGKELFALAKSLCATTSTPSSPASTTGGTNIALYLPRNVDLNEVAALVRTPRAVDGQSPGSTTDDDVDSVSDDSGDGTTTTVYDQGPVHLEECWLNGRLKAVCAYFGELASAWDPERDGWTG